MEVHRRSIDLTTVEDMDEQEYQDLLRFVAQWDAADTPAQLAELRKARGEKPVEAQAPVEEAPAPEASDDLEHYTVEELKAELTLLDLPVTGHKADLVARLREAGGPKT